MEVEKTSGIVKREVGENYTEEEIVEMKEKVLFCVSRGMALSKITKENIIVCNRKTVYIWLKKDIDFLKRYDAAQIRGIKMKAKKLASTYIDTAQIAAEKLHE